jgi:hypothetical protein
LSRVALLEELGLAEVRVVEESALVDMTVVQVNR